jgi:uncharacterized protein with von Willebrand factor type A (vWA) domain
LPSLPKHIVFVLDISGSMEGEKIQQTKDAMVTILDDLGEKDHFNLLTFSDEVREWRPKENDTSGKCKNNGLQPSYGVNSTMFLLS